MARRTRRARRTSEIFVKFAETGGEVHEYCLNGERTIEALLEIVGVGTEGKKIRVNGEVADLETELKNEDVVTVSGKIEGGRT